MAAALLAVAPSAVQSQVRFERTGYRLTSIGERMAVSARVVDARRRPVANANIRWRVADPSIATVTPNGVVISKKPGYTKLWAVAGQDSASALILVDQWAAKFDFAPAVVRFDAVGSTIPLRVLTRDAAGHVIAPETRRTASCRSLNPRIAQLTSTSQLNARSNGVTYVRCTDRGIADSVRVEVRQRPSRAAILDKLQIGQKVVGDTFRIRLSAFDRAGDEIRDVQPTWASLNGNILSVDPLTGLARTVGAGTGKVVAQVGDVTDTVSIAVALAPGMPVPTASDSANGPSAVAGAPKLTFLSLYLMVGDTGRVTASVQDAVGNVNSNPTDIALHSSDTSVAAIVPTRTGKGVLARKTGVTYVVGQFGLLVDSLIVSVRAKGATNSAATTAVASAAFERPRFDTVAARVRNQRQLDSAARAIRRASVVAEATGRMVSISGVAASAAHSTRLTKAFSESRTGLLYGGTAEIAPFSWLKANVDFRTGQLSTNGTTGEDMTITEGEAALTFSPAPWFGLQGGYVKRAESTPLALQRWEFPRVGAVTRFPFVGGALTTVMGIAILPGATYTGYFDPTGKQVTPNPLSLSGNAGLEINTGLLSAALTYYVERFTFPVVNGEIRKDQFSMIRLRVGLQAGR